MAFRPACAALVGILAFSQQPASAESSLMGTIAEVFRYPAVMPLPVFEGLKPAILPGSPIFGMPGRSEPGAEVVDAGRIRTCTISDPAPAFRRSTEGFLQRFVGTENIDELRLLFGLSDQDARSIDTYEVRLGNAVSFTAPSDTVEKSFASAMKDKSCIGAQPAVPRMVVRTIVADLDVEFRGRQPLSASIAEKL
ncbi:MAG: hypothetical protein WB764_27750, partial [Xanthobacteraceae bacterium]